MLLRRIVFNYDNDYKRVTSFLGLYENGGGPGGDGGVDSNPRIQTYIYVLEGATGRAYYRNGESVHMVGGIGSVFIHELCHLIFFGNHYSPPYNFGAPNSQDPDNPPYPNNWYVKFLPIMAQVVFYDDYDESAVPKELFVDWEYGPDQDYRTYILLAQFLVEKYGNAIFYDLFHDAAINKEALENVLRKRGSTISVMEIEFTAWCNNGGTQS